MSETSEPPVPGSAELTASLTKKLEAGHANMASPTTLSYTLNLTTLPTQAATIAEKLKASGATTVVFAGDPIMPIYLTKACASIGYFPEWIITGIVLTDTAALGRYYDQSEWAHAFGVTSLAVPVPVGSGDADRLYHWWYGAKATPASLAAPAIIPPIEQFFTGVQLAGPDLTPSTFTTGLFRAPPAGGGPTTPLDAYGYQGAAPRPSYSSPADYTFLWYDATAKGPDEEGTNGTGLMRYVNGGARYRRRHSAGRPRAHVHRGGLGHQLLPRHRTGHRTTPPGRVHRRRQQPADPPLRDWCYPQFRTPGSGILTDIAGPHAGTGGAECPAPVAKGDP